MASFQVQDGGPVIEYDDREILIKGAEKNTGFLSSGWKVKYSRTSNTNATDSFNIKGKSTSGMTMGSTQLKFHW